MGRGTFRSMLERAKRKGLNSGSLWIDFQFPLPYLATPALNASSSSAVHFCFGFPIALSLPQRCAAPLLPPAPLFLLNRRWRFSFENRSTARVTCPFADTYFAFVYWSLKRQRFNFLRLLRGVGFYRVHQSFCSTWNRKWVIPP